MAKQRQKVEEDHSGDWLNTYADMVTLLLTFFVLLFACSNMDETKIQYIFQAFQVHGRYVNTIISKPDNTVQDESSAGNTDTSDNQGGEGEMPQSFDQLYQYLSEYIDENDLGESMSLDQSASQVTIRLKSGVLFDGDSYRLKAEGREILSGIIPALKGLNPLIQNIIITGHTAYVPNPTMNVYMLSSMRAVSVQEYLGINKTVDENKYATYGYGPNKPIADNDTADGKQQNRRVELIIQRNQADLDLNDVEVIRDMLEHQFNLSSDKYNPQDPPPTPPELLPDGSADKIVAEIQQTFTGTGGSSGVYTPGGVDLNDFVFTTDNEAESSED